MYCVYIHTNKTNGKMYIGVTIHEDNPNKRWAGGKNYIKNTHFYNAIKKYGWDGFTHEIYAKNLSKEDAMAIEMLLIEYFQTTNPNMGYNKTSGGDVGTKLSKESLLKQSQSLKKFYSEHPERKKIISEQTSGEKNPMYGKNIKDFMSEENDNKWLYHLKNVSDETKQKMRDNHADFSGKNSYLYGKHRSEETKAKIRKTIKERGNNVGTRNPNFGNHKLAGGKNPRARTIYCVELDELFWGFTDAENKTKVCHSTISNCCKHRRDKTISHSDKFSDLHWMFADEAVELGIIEKGRLDTYNKIILDTNNDM